MRLALTRALVMSSGAVPRRSAGALRRLAGGDSPEALASALDAEGWTAGEIEAACDGSGKSPVHFAAWRGHPANVGVLVGAGCGVDAPATGEFSYGKTPLFFAVTRCRDETVLRLLAAGAATKIVNNKGQSVRTLALSHLSAEAYAAVVAAEENDDRPWINFRKTHSDGLVYGDLDRRFLDRPLAPEDRVDDVAVNPTTKASRRGAFARNNREAVLDVPPPRQPPRKPEAFVAPSGPPPNAVALLAAVRGDGDEVATALAALADAWKDHKGAWIAETAAVVRGAVDADALRAALRVLQPEGGGGVSSTRLAARVCRRALDEDPPKCTPPPPPPREFRRPKPRRPPGADRVDAASLPRAELSAPPTWVDDVRGLRALGDRVRSADRAAFDAEFSEAGGLATLQVAFEGHDTFVVEAKAATEAYAEAYAALLADLAAVPALFGYATRQDLRYLGDWKNVVDLQPAGSQQPSLQRAVADELGLYVDKRLQVSAWDDRPLSTDQLAYAALDARLCLDLARALGT